MSNILTSKMESLTKAKLDSQLNELIKQQRICNKPHCGSNSYSRYKQVDNIIATEKPINLIKSTFQVRT